MSRILVVEDEVLIRELAVEQLSDAGHAVTAARNGEEALRLLQHEDAFDLLFTDIRMPGEIDGWELAREARRIHPGLSVIYASGFAGGDASIVDNARVIGKPYLFDEVRGALQDLGIACR